MPSWDEVLVEMENYRGEIGDIRKKYIRNLIKYTKRNVILYYSGWQYHSEQGVEIDDQDMIGFMNAIKGMKREKGLDLILHTPGGSPTASESLVKYLKTTFNKDIRVIVPHMAMSAGTMISCAAKEIVMGEHSSLGPIDPQFSGVPAYNIKDEFEEAKKDLVINPENSQYWAIRLQQYPAAFLKTALDTIELSNELACSWLSDNMFAEEIGKQKVEKIVAFLNEHKKSKVHDRHFSVQQCIDIGLRIRRLEDDPELQDLILSIHHAMTITLSNTSCIKIIENDKKTYAIHMSK